MGISHLNNGPDVIHDLAMMRLEKLSIQDLNNEQLYYEYKKIVTELSEARSKYSKEHDEGARIRSL
jgi:hypothetical protein